MPITDSSGNVIHGSGSFTFIGTESDLMYRSLIKPIRDLDAPTLFVKRFLKEPQRQYELTADRIADLATTDDPATCRADLLQYLKAHVGFTSELRAITDRLTTGQLRKLITLAVPLWKKKGTADGLLAIVRLLTGRTPLYMDWFQFRNILGETQVGEDHLGNDSWVIGGSVTINDEFHSHIRLMDDGTLDEVLLIDLMKLFRPLSERIEIAVVDFIDRFDDPTLDRWVQAPGYSVAGTLDATTKEMVLPTGAGMRMVAPRFATFGAFIDTMVTYKFKLVAANSAHRLMVNYFDANNYYQLDITTTSMVLTRVNAGVATAISTVTMAGAPLQVVVGSYYALRVQTLRASGSGVIVRVYLDSSTFIDLTDATGTAHSGLGTAILASQPAGGEVRVDNAELFNQPLRFATIGPTGVTESANFIA